jgi:TatD DNase family protein
MLIDSHCHLTDQQFSGDRLDVLGRAHDAGVGKVLSIASDRRDTERVVALLDSFRGAWPAQGPKSDPDGSRIPEIWGTAGVHPHEVKDAQDGDLDALRDIIRATPRIVAVGETGLDFYYDNSPRALQEALFRDHLALAHELDLPIVVHSRNADELTEDIIREWGSRVKGVLHCFTGGAELLETALSEGWMISFTGIITFKKYDAQALVRRVPRERLMIETDAPYLAPVPHRGRRNEPAFVAGVAQSLANIRGEDLDTVLGYTSENATRFFTLIP